MSGAFAILLFSYLHSIPLLESAPFALGWLLGGLLIHHLDKRFLQ